MTIPWSFYYVPGIAQGVLRPVNLSLYGVKSQKWVWCSFCPWRTHVWRYVHIDVNLYVHLHRYHISPTSFNLPHYLSEDLSCFTWCHSFVLVCICMCISASCPVTDYKLLEISSTVYSPLQPLEHCYFNYGPCACRIGITWELFRAAESGAHPDLLNWELWVGPRNLCFSICLGDLQVCSSLQSTVKVWNPGPVMCECSINNLWMIAYINYWHWIGEVGCSY